MKAKLGILAAILMAICMVARPSAYAVGVDIEVGDRPYYTYGPSYWDRGYEYSWAPGRWDEHHHWVHGRYSRHGEFVREHEHDRRHRVEVVEPGR